MPSYLLIDVGGGRDEIEADSDEHARAQAQQILHGAAADHFACEDNHQSTIWLDCDVVRKPTAEEDSEGPRQQPPPHRVRRLDRL